MSWWSDEGEKSFVHLLSENLSLDFSAYLRYWRRLAGEASSADKEFFTEKQTI
jgi:hypothetical protein